jgi:predicted CoA-binding protein
LARWRTGALAIGARAPHECVMQSDSRDATMGNSGRELDSDDELRALLQSVKRVAVLGIKTEAQSQQPAFYVADYLVKAGLDVVPVPVYYPDVTTILGRTVYRALADVPGPVDLVNVFRRGQDVPPHVPDILAANPRAVWLQLGIRSDVAAAELLRHGIHVIQDRCLMVEHRRLVRR